jgi:hypothetical protein
MTLKISLILAKDVERYSQNAFVGASQSLTYVQILEEGKAFELGESPRTVAFRTHLCTDWTQLGIDGTSTASVAIPAALCSTQMPTCSFLETVR